MRSVTSCFNKTLVRTDVKRFWPLLFLYTAVWIIMLPVYQWADQGYRFGNVGFYPGDYLYDMMFAGLIMAVIFGGLFSMAVFSYLMNSRSVGLMHALPVSRGTQFCSHVVSVMGMLTAAKLLVAVLTVCEQAIFGDVAIKAIALWLLVCTLMELFFLSLGILCCMVTGWLLAAPVLYAGINCLAILVTLLLRALGQLFYFGYASSYDWPTVTRWLTPVYTLGETLGDNFRPVAVEIVDDEIASYNGSIGVADVVRQARELNPDAIGPLAVYTALGLVLLAVSYFLYTRRASESAGDPVAFAWARPIFRYVASLLGGLAFGLGLFSLLTVNSDKEGLALLLGCFVLMGILCYFAVEMVIRKSFRVFGKGWPGAIAVAAMLVLVCVGAKLDITGYEHRIPNAEKIESVDLNIYMEDTYVSVSDPETIEAVLELHKAVTAEGREPIDLEGNYGINLEYRMNDGTDVRRRYTLSMPVAMESDAITNALREVINCEEVRYRNTLNGITGLEKGKFRGGYISGRYMDYNQQISAEDAQRIYDAVLTDLANGAGGQEPFELNEKEFWAECTVSIELEAENEGLWLDRIRPDFKALVEVLNDMGLDSETLFQLDPAYAEKYGW